MFLGILDLPERVHAVAAPATNSAHATRNARPVKCHVGSEWIVGHSYSADPKKGVRGDIGVFPSLRGIRV